MSTTDARAVRPHRSRSRSRSRSRDIVWDSDESARVVSRDIPSSPVEMVSTTPEHAVRVRRLQYTPGSVPSSPRPHRVLHARDPYGLASYRKHTPAEKGETSLMYVCRVGLVDKVADVFEAESDTQYTACADTQSPAFGMPPLVACVALGHPACAWALISAGANVRVAHTTTGDTALHWASARAVGEVVYALLRAGALRGARNAAGLTAGEVAAARAPHPAAQETSNVRARALREPVRISPSHAPAQAADAMTI